jgi:hypothetical protein
VESKLQSNKCRQVIANKCKLFLEKISRRHIVNLDIIFIFVAQLKQVIKLKFKPLWQALLKQVTPKT